MSAPAIEMYDDALRRGGTLRLLGGTDTVPVDLPRWRSPADPVDRDLLRRCSGRTLDVGCGPGRLVAELAARGVPALGVDLAPAAVALARTAGARALRRDVFGLLPHEGRWREVLLIDGNVGIGGDPAALLARVRRLLAPGGRLLAEVETHHVDEVALVVLEDERGGLSRPFHWARVGSEALVMHAAAVGMLPVATWAMGGRAFVELASQTCHGSG
ncbi:MAG: class I SAM-dependent methyltransferase [Actinomycetota bacterium]|nr:class I SAM-dependent methyltransferase [Actinomycetota bacterium]